MHVPHRRLFINKSWRSRLHRRYELLSHEVWYNQNLLWTLWSHWYDQRPYMFQGIDSYLFGRYSRFESRRFLSTLNAPCPISDFHNIIGAATKRFAAMKTPQTIYYRSYKHFIESDFCYDIERAPFYVMNIFDDVYDMAWFTSSLIKYVVDNHAPVKSITVKFQSVPYMNSALRKAQYKRTMARNRFKRYGKSCWEENRRHRNLVVKIRKSSMRKYFEDKCSKQDRHFWKTISPFFSDKRFRNGQNIALSENDNIVNDP